MRSNYEYDIIEIKIIGEYIMEEDFQLNMNFMDENPQSSKRSESRNRSKSPETTRIQPHMHTIAQENPNPLGVRRSSMPNEIVATDTKGDKISMADMVRTSMKKVQLQEYQHDISQMTMYNIVPSPRDDRDWNSEAIFDHSSKLPRKLDLRRKLNLPKNQGYQGTCAAHVAACMKEWQERKDVGFKGHMSSQFVYNNRNNQLSNGMYGRDVMNILKNIGCCTEDSYPYEKIEAASEIDPKFLEEAANYKIKGYARVNTIDTLKRALLINGPCYISFPVYNYSNYMWRQYKGEKKLGGHAMTVVGYDLKGFIIRNSWGVFWDGDGHCHYPYGDWGSHYEVWTTIDEKSEKLPQKKMFLSKVCSVVTGAVCSIKLPTITLPSLPELPKKEKKETSEEKTEQTETTENKEETDLIQDNTVDKDE